MIGFLQIYFHKTNVPAVEKTLRHLFVYNRKRFAIDCACFM